MTTELVTVYLGLGSNMGDCQQNLNQALDLLGQRLRIKNVSSIHDTEPVGDTEQPRFLNMVCQAHTRLEPADLLALVKGIEKKLGRTGKSGAPRPIDIDILLYGEQIIETTELTIPHPRMAERAFVLEPLAEITPEILHPVSGRTAKEMLQDLKEGRQGKLPLENT